MFLTFLRFELRFWLRAMMVYVFLGVIGLLVFGAASSDDVVVGGGLENSLRNSPFVIQNFYAVMALLSCPMIAAFVNSAASRDFTYDTHQLIFSKPLDKFGYVMGRFWGATLVAVIPMLGVSLGVVLAGWMPWIDAVRFGPISWGAHLWGFLVFALPNAIFLAALIFAIAVMTRSTIASFIGALLVLVGYTIAEQMVSDLDNENIAMLLDPFGITTFNLQTKYWTVADKNSQYVVLSGMMLWNRLLWFAVSGGILGFTYWRFSFSERPAKRPRKATAARSDETARNLPNYTIHGGRRLNTAALWSQFKIEFLATVRSTVFIVVMLAGLINLVAALWLDAGEGFGLSSLPVTYNVIDLVRGTLYIFLIAVITFYAGVFVWKEREAKLDEVYDALPHATWTVFVGKLMALICLVAVILSFAAIVGICSQAINGYTRFQVGVYSTELLVLDMLQFSFMIVLAFLCHVASPNKYIGYFSFVILLVTNALAWNLIHVETLLVKYGRIPSHVYSDFYGFAPYTSALAWFSSYWACFALLIATVAIMLWQRGRERGVRVRLHKAVANCTGTLRLTAASALAGWIGIGGWVAYNTLMVNEFQNSEQTIVKQVNYEQRLKQYESLAQPRVTKIAYDIEIFPETRALRLKAEQTIVNQSDKPIEHVHMTVAYGYQTTVEIEGARLAEDFVELDYRIYAFEPPLQPGVSRQMTYTVTYEAVGFENRISNTSIVQNGSFFNSGITPQIGYQSTYELQDKNDRKRHGLGEPTIMPPLEPDNLAARANTYLSNSSDWVDVETTISTSADQVAIAPGSLQRSWEQDGRRYFLYKLDHPSLNFYSFISARYQIAARQWNGIDIEVYYHPEHQWNVDNMLRSIRKSLEYYTENFGPYRHKQARIIEFPRVSSFAQAFPGTMPYSESIGFIADIDDVDDIDMVFYVVAHEMAHQWWAHQVIGANMLGATVLSETLAQYSSLMVMEREFGRDMMRKFLRYEMDNYLRSRGREMLKERPLLEVAGNQGYVHYRKGSVVMYHLREMIGEDRVNAALRKLVEKFAYQGPPYPTSVDLVEALREEAPEEFHYLFADLFEQITLFSNRVIDGTYTEREDGSFDVMLKVDCRKFQADDHGAETEVPIDEWIEVGAFAEPATGRKYGRTLHRERVRVSSGESVFRFTVDEKPARVAIDPFSLLIDRVPDDNFKKPAAN